MLWKNLSHVPRMTPLPRQTERRLREWRNRRRMLLETRIKEWGEYLQDRQQNWRNTHFLAASEPSTQLVLVVVGVRGDGA